MSFPLYVGLLHKPSFLALLFLCWISWATDHVSNTVSNVIARMSLPLDRGDGIDENPLRKVWIPWMMPDPVLFQATMTYAAVHWNLLQGRDKQGMTLVKKNKTMNMINERFKSIETAMGNSTIGAIAMLAAAEVSLPQISCIMIYCSIVPRTDLNRGWTGMSKSYAFTSRLLRA